MNYKLIELTSFGDCRGSLVALEKGHNVLFDIKRVFYIYDTKRDVPRGCHAHKFVEQVLICVTGSCKVRLKDGVSECVFELNTPEQALYIDKHVWNELFDFSQGCVLMVLASDYYKPEEYIRDYDEFLLEVGR